MYKPVKIKVKDTFQIVPVEHTKFGIIYKLMERNLVHGTYVTMEKAIDARNKILALREEIAVIKATDGFEIAVES